MARQKIKGISISSANAAGNANATSGYVLKADGSGGAAWSADSIVAGISSSADATAITINSSEQVTFAGNVTIGSVAAGSSTATPLELNLGSTFSDAAGSKSKMKLKVFEDTSSNILGLGVSAGTLELHSNQTFTFLVNESEKMRVDSSGNVLVGTSTFNNLSTESGVLASNNVVMARGGLADHQDACAVLQYTSDAAWLRAYGDTSGSGYMIFRVGGGAGSTDAEAMRINSSGKVGIGNTSPTAKFDLGTNNVTRNATYDVSANAYISTSGGAANNTAASIPLTIGRDDDASTGDEIGLTYNFDNGNWSSTAGVFARVESASTAYTSLDLRTWGGGWSTGLTVTSAGHVAITSGKRFYFNVNSIGSGDTYIDEYSANEVGITTGGSRKLAISGGNLYCAGSLNANHNFSDERLKENITIIPNALEKVKTLRGITFTRKDDGSQGTGLIAQELEKVLPSAVYESKKVDSLEDPEAEEWKGINYGNTVGLLVQAIKELEAKVKELENK